MQMSVEVQKYTRAISNKRGYLETVVGERGREREREFHQYDCKRYIGIQCLG